MVSNPSLINLIGSQAHGDYAGNLDSALNKSITLITASDPKNQLDLMLATQLAVTHISFGNSALLLGKNYSAVKTINSPIK